MSNSISSNRKSLGERLVGGESVRCQKCHDGTYIPTFPQAKIKHDFHCNKCGDRVHLEANVVVE